MVHLENPRATALATVCNPPAGTRVPQASPSPSQQLPALGPQDLLCSWLYRLGKKIQLSSETHTSPAHFKCLLD